MKFQRFETGVGPQPDEAAVAPAVDAPVHQDATIEELPGATPLTSPGHGDRWLGITIAISAALVCFGFVSHATGPSAMPSASPGSEMAGANPSVPASSPPAEPTPSPTPTLSGSGADGSAGADERRASPGWSPLPAWQARFVADGKGRHTLLVDGNSDASVQALTIRILTRSGQLVGGYPASVAMEDERPGSNGQPRTELGFFEREIALSNDLVVRGFVVELAWHDILNGTSGTVQQPVATPNGVRGTIWEPFLPSASLTL